MTDLSKLTTLISIIKKKPDIVDPANGTTKGMGQIYCPVCNDYRKVDFKPEYSPLKRQMMAGMGINIKPDIQKKIVPSLFIYTCPQCNTDFTAVIYKSSNKSALAIIPSSTSRKGDKNVPVAVAYYLDQAYKAHAIGANSAAVAMFRGALEQIMFEQGYQKGMLGGKIEALKKDVNSGTAPKWAMDLDIEYLKVLKELGDGSIHPNNGDIKKQKAIDTSLITNVKEVFQQLLALVYEIPTSKGKQLSRLQAKANILKK